MTVKGINYKAATLYHYVSPSPSTVGWFEIH